MVRTAELHLRPAQGRGRPVLIRALPIAPLLPPELDTPALVVDLDIVEMNARRMAVALAGRGVSLRPHVKTHKSVALARIQIDAGAVGITVGTLGEAEVMADGGIDDIFLAFPIWAAGTKAERLRALTEREGVRFSVGVDSIAGVGRLAATMAGSSRPLRVLVEVDPRYGRTGVAPESAAEIASAAHAAGLEVVGLFVHGGHAYADLDAAPSAADDEVAALSAAADALRGVGIEPQVLSSGSSPTALHSARPPVTEMRPGTYLIGDRMQVALGVNPADGVAIAVVATVVSETLPGQVVIDAGAKSLTKDVAPYLTGYGLLAAYPQAELFRVSDYHGQVRVPDGAPRPALGEVVAVVPNHACPVIDLFDSFVATRSGITVGRWKVDARGRSG